MPELNMKGIVKRFGGVVALDRVDFDVRPGEVMALVGDNGAGKSTLIKVLAGAYEPDGGEILLGGRPVTFKTPQDAQKHGIATIFQELALAAKMPIADNIFLGQELTRKLFGIPFLDRRTMRNRTRQLLSDLDVHVPDMNAWVENLSGGQRQGIAIARALNVDANLIVMDEPTAALAVAEVDKVLQFIDSVRSQGKGVVVISHNIQDVFEVSDRITVLRQGRQIGVRETGATTPEEIIGLITGASAVKARTRRPNRVPSEAN